MHSCAVVGGGIGGLTAVAVLLDRATSDADSGVDTIYWVDPHFHGGRLHEHYREVPSNTQVARFLTYVESSPTLQAADKVSGATEELRSKFRPTDTCPLAYASDLATALTKTLRRTDERVLSQKGFVTWLRQKGNAAHGSPTHWELELQTGAKIAAKIVVLATGSHPKVLDWHESTPNLCVLPLDVALSPSRLADTLSCTICPNSAQIGVVGNSHSAVLVLRNLVALQRHVVHFYRSKCLYAVREADGSFKYDNTGLKGVAALWALEYLDPAERGEAPETLDNVIEDRESNEKSPEEPLEESPCLSAGTKCTDDAVPLATDKTTPPKHLSTAQKTLLPVQTSNAPRDFTCKSYKITPSRSRFLTRVHIPNSVAAEDASADLFPSLTYIIYAIGYEANDIPNIEIDGNKQSLRFCNIQNRFFSETLTACNPAGLCSGAEISVDHCMENAVEGLFGIGVAFPNQITDISGKREFSVGFPKFLVYGKTAVDSWCDAIKAHPK